MEVGGALGFPCPRPLPILQKPQPVPRIAAGLLETVLVEVTRPAPRAFTVRIFDEDQAPPAADVVSVFLFYGVPVGTIARRLEAAWKTVNLRAEPGLRYASCTTYDHPKGFEVVLGTIEALQESFLH